MLSEANWAATGLPPPSTSIRMLAVSGMRIVGRAQLEALMLGDAPVRGVGTSIMPADTGVLNGTRAGGSIGATLLRRFHVVIDIAACLSFLCVTALPLIAAFP